MNTELQLFLQNNALALAAGEVDEDTKAIAGAGGKRISIKAGVFRKIVGGKEVASIEERHMDIVFVKAAHTPSRQYYKGAFVEGSKLPPNCWSEDGKTPDAACKTPQSSACDTCQWAAKGSGNDGKSSACRLAWRTAVVLPSDPEGDVMGLSIPAASCFGDEESGRWPFRAYAQMLANHNISLGRVVTQMSFDTKATMPRVLFKPVSAVPPEHISTIAAQGKSLDAQTAVKLNVFVKDPVQEAAPQPFQQPVAAPQPAVAPVVPSVTAVAPVAPTGGSVTAAQATVVMGGTKANPFAAKAQPAAVAPAEAPVQATPPPIEGVVTEPVLRPSGAPVEPRAETDVSEIVKKWSKKATS